MTFSYQDQEVAGREFRCERITNSTEYLPGDHYDRATVDRLCVSQAWVVTIVDARASS